ncbi:MAG: YggS family pyridoxal phosphate-dependent enzyme [Ornithinimicrobium sp.]
MSDQSQSHASQDDQARALQLRDSLHHARSRIDRACSDSGRDAAGITLIVVTKFFPARDVLSLVDLGVRDIGESRDQEARPKVEQVGLRTDPERMPRVHMIGQVQTKKARSIARYADVVHSVDRARLVTALDRAAGAAIEQGERSGRLDVTLQVDLDGGDNERRGGVPVQDASALADDIAGCEFLRLRGVMAIAPAQAAGDDVALGSAFEALARCHELIVASHPAATWLSAGMSGDLEHAIAAGATHLRVGSVILGSRPPQR